MGSASIQAGNGRDCQLRHSTEFQVNTDCVDFLLDLTKTAEFSGAPIYDSFYVNCCLFSLVMIV